MGLQKGGAEEVTTVSVMNARDWLFRTGLLSIQPGGAEMSVMTRWGDSGLRPSLARRSTWLFILSLA